MKKSLSWLGPFSHREFAAIWFCCTGSLTGLAMFDTASAWIMTGLNPDPRMISMVQVSIALPMFLFTYVAGAIADLLEPRRFLIVLETIITIVVFAFSMIVFKGLVTPNKLLLTTFLLATLSSIAAPAWLSINPLLVPDHQLDGANAANSIGYNISRSIGPPLAGVAIAKLSMAAPYFLYALADIFTIIALVWWRPAPRTRVREKAEKIWGALWAGFQEAVRNKELRATIIRTLAISPFASASTALLPLIARNQITAGGSELYGALLAATSIGALIGSFALSPLRKRVHSEIIFGLATAGAAVGLVLFGFAHSKTAATAAALLVGASMLIVQVDLYTSALLALPEWVRSRGVAILLTVLFACLMVGSIVWGQVAAHYGPGTALFSAAIAILVLIPLTWKWKLKVAA